MVRYINQVVALPLKRAGASSMLYSSCVARPDIECIQCMSCVLWNIILEVVEYEKRHNAVTLVPVGYFERALAAEKAVVENLPVVSVAGTADANSGNNVTAHESIVGRKDRQVSETTQLPHSRTDMPEHWQATRNDCGLAFCRPVCGSVVAPYG